MNIIQFVPGHILFESEKEISSYIAVENGIEKFACNCYVYRRDESIGKDASMMLAIGAIPDHKAKIDMVDSIYVINVGGYVGSSTKSESEDAIAHGKEVRYLEEP